MLFPVTFPHFLQLLLVKFQFTKVSDFLPPFFNMLPLHSDVANSTVPLTKTAS